MIIILCLPYFSSTKTRSTNHAAIVNIFKAELVKSDLPDPRLVGWLVFYGTFSINMAYFATDVRNILYRAGDRQQNNKLSQQKYTKVFFSLVFV